MSTAKDLWPRLSERIRLFVLIYCLTYVRERQTFLWVGECLKKNLRSFWPRGLSVGSQKTGHFKSTGFLSFKRAGRNYSRQLSEAGAPLRTVQREMGRLTPPPCQSLKSEASFSSLCFVDCCSQLTSDLTLGLKTNIFGIHLLLLRGISSFFAAP